MCESTTAVWDGFLAIDHCGGTGVRIDLKTAWAAIQALSKVACPLFLFPSVVDLTIFTGIG